MWRRQRMPFGQERERAGIDGSLADFIRALRGASGCHGNIGSLAMVMAAWSRAGQGRRVRAGWWRAGGGRGGG
jgi:hypothetical protein